MTAAPTMMLVVTVHLNGGSSMERFQFEQEADAQLGDAAQVSAMA
jgi:hypothetical protein